MESNLGVVVYPNLNLTAATLKNGALEMNIFENVTFRVIELRSNSKPKKYFFGEGIKIFQVLQGDSVKFNIQGTKQKTENPIVLRIGANDLEANGAAHYYSLKGNQLFVKDAVEIEMFVDTKDKNFIDRATTVSLLEID